MTALAMRRGIRRVDMRKGMSAALLAAALSAFLATGSAGDETQRRVWTDSSFDTELSSPRLSARFQGGMLYKLVDKTSGKTLISIDPSTISPKVPLFGNTSVNLKAFAVEQTKSDRVLSVTYTWMNAIKWLVKWHVAADGSLVLQSWAKSTEPAKEFQISFAGCDLTAHTLILSNENDLGSQATAPWDGEIVRYASNVASPGKTEPIAAVFRGEGGGWMLESWMNKGDRATLTATGRGKTAEVAIARLYRVPTRNLALPEVRFGTYTEELDRSLLH